MIYSEFFGQTTIGLRSVVAVMVVLWMIIDAVVGESGKIIQITDETNFCLLMPARAGQTVGESEGSAVSKCMPGADRPPGARTMHDGTVIAAHVVVTDDYIQVTGLISASAAKMDGSDDGGQYDNAEKGSEPQSSCEGYQAYVELLSGYQFCLRCCESWDVDSSDSACNVHQDTEGCAVVIGGSYDDGFSYTDERSSNDYYDDDDDEY